MAWIVSKPGGPSGPFYSVVSDTGEVIAMQIPSKENAERIANLPSIARIHLSAGRYYLTVNGVVVAVEGDINRDPNMPQGMWNKTTLQQAADKINKGA